MCVKDICEAQPRSFEDMPIQGKFIYIVYIIHTNTNTFEHPVPAAANTEEYPIACRLVRTNDFFLGIQKLICSTVLKIKRI